MKRADHSPKKSRAVLEDLILYWMRGSHDSDIRAVVEFDGRLDFDRLASAARLCLDAEPVLGRRFVPDNFGAHWERVPDLDRSEIASLFETSAYDGDFGRFLVDAPGTDLFSGPQIRLSVLRSKADTLVIRINHVAGDGGGLKDLTLLLSETYRKLKENPGYAPPVNTGSRSLRQIFSRFGRADLLKIVRRSFRDAAEFLRPAKFLTSSLETGCRTHPAMLVRRVPAERFARVRAYGKSHSATVNDVMVAAHLRAFYRFLNPGGWPRLVITADLRRHLPREQAEAVCNLSGFFYLDLGRNLGESFDETLFKVRDRIDALKKDYLALGNFPLTTLAFKSLPLPLSLKVHDFLGHIQKKQAKTEGRVAPLFTNTGAFGDFRADFGGVNATNAYITTTVAYPPVVAVCLSGFAGGLTLTGGFYEGFIGRPLVERFLDLLIAELPA